jgi:hypothetical protein
MHGVQRFIAGIYPDTVRLSGACDTIYLDTLGILPAYNISGNKHAFCPGDSIFIYGYYHHLPGLVYDSLSSIYGCDSTIIDTLIYAPQPSASAGSDITINEGESALLQGHGGPPFLWNNGATDSSISVSPLSDTLYILEVKNDSNCSDRDTVIVHVLPKESKLQTPDAFTPNGDGINDRFTVFGQGIATYDISIFNRWGELIYHSSDPGELNNTAKGWDGTFMQQEQVIGTYIYAIHYSSSDAKKFFVQGSVSLIR